MLKTKDLFILIKIFKKINIKEQFKKLAEISDITETEKEEIEKIQKQKGAELIGYIIDNITEVEEEIYQIVASYSDTDIENVKNQDPVLTINAIKEILKSDVFRGFLAQAMQ